MMDFVFKMMDFVFKMMDFVFKMMDFVFKMMDFVFKMMDFADTAPELCAGIYCEFRLKWPHFQYCFHWKSGHFNRIRSMALTDRL